MGYRKKCLIIAAIAAPLCGSSCTQSAQPAENTTAAVPTTESATTAAASETAAETSETSVTTAETTTAEETEAAAVGIDDTITIELKTGTWWAAPESKGESTDDCYYYFAGDGTGHVTYQDYGIGVGYNYTLDGSRLTFEMGGEGAFVAADAADAQDGGIILCWDDGRTEKLTYMSAEDDISFYSSYDLVEMAKWYYSYYNDGYEPSEGDTWIDEDGRIVIHLFDLVDDHTSTAAWYYIDRFTAKGEDLLGNSVDLAPFGQTYDGSGVVSAYGDNYDPPTPGAFYTMRRTLREEGDLFGVKYLGYIDPNANDPEGYASYIQYLLEYTGAVEDCELDMSMPYENFVSTDLGTELYIIIPRSPYGTVRVCEYRLDGDTATLTEGDTLYTGDGAPILLKCNVSEIFPDVIIYITGADGNTVSWSPGLSGENGHVLTYHPDGKIHDFSDYDRLAGTEQAPVG